jgi:hypothetical protein
MKKRHGIGAGPDVTLNTIGKKEHGGRVEGILV